MRVTSMKALRIYGPIILPKKTFSLKKTNIKHISFIGSGNVATHLALAFHAAGHIVDQVLSREFDHAQLLASRVSAVAIDRTELLRSGSDFYFLAVNDDAIFDLALDLRLPEATVVHTSGSTPLSVLQSISQRHGVVWSPQTFVRDIAMDYLHLPFCIEGSSLEVTDEIPLHIRRHLRDFRCKLLGPILPENPLPCGIGLLKSRDRVKFGNCHKAHTLWQFRKN